MTALLISVCVGLFTVAAHVSGLIVLERSYKARRSLGRAGALTSILTALGVLGLHLLHAAAYSVSYKASGVVSAWSEAIEASYLYYRPQLPAVTPQGDLFLVVAVEIGIACLMLLATVVFFFRVDALIAPREAD